MKAVDTSRDNGLECQRVARSGRLAYDKGWTISLWHLAKKRQRQHVSGSNSGLHLQRAGAPVVFDEVVFVQQGSRRVCQVQAPLSQLGVCIYGAKSHTIQLQSISMLMNALYLIIYSFAEQQRCYLGLLI